MKKRWFRRKTAGERCASCDIELSGEAMFWEGEAFCCPGCAQRGPCSCSYEDYKRRRAAAGHPASIPELLRLYMDSGEARKD